MRVLQTFGLQQQFDALARTEVQVDKPNNPESSQFSGGNQMA
jgi:hypothetical protein